MAGKVTFDFLPGFQFLRCLQRGPLAEQWVAMGPDGRMRSVKFVGGLGDHTTFPPRHLLHIAGLKSLRIPGLAPVEAVINDGGRFVLVGGWTGVTLRDRLRECRHQHPAAIPRPDLLAFLRPVAEALEELNRRQGLHHLSLDPASIHVHHDTAQVADYGLVELIWYPAGQPLANASPRYAAPELFDDQFSQTSDQYSLALIYLEMATGSLPQEGHSLAQWKQLRRERPCLDGLIPEDREILARALSRDPRQRFGRLTDLVRALEAVMPPREEGLVWAPYSHRPAPVIQELPLAEAGLVVPGADALVSRAVEAAAAASQVEERLLDGVRCLVRPDGSWFHRCAAWLPQGTLTAKLAGLLRTWDATIVENREDRLTFQMAEPKGLWQKLMAGFQRDLEVQIRLLPPRAPGVQVTEVTVWLRYLGRNSGYGRQLLAVLAPPLLRELRTYLLAMPEQRQQERFAYAQPLNVAAILPQAGAGVPVPCVAKDISRTGISFIAPGTPPSALVYIQTVDPAVGPLTLPARVVRIKPAGGGDQCEIAARFVLDRPPRDPAPPTTAAPVTVPADWERRWP